MVTTVKGGVFSLADNTLVINVKDAPFNAQGDGVTNDSAAFAAAVQFIQDNYPAGGTIYLPAGIYIGTIVLEDYIEWVGAGRFATTVKSPDANSIIETAAAGCERVAIRNMRLTGDGTNNTNHGLELSGVGKGRINGIELSNVHIKGCGGKGINAYGETSSGATPHVQNLTAIHCTITDCQEEGIYAVDSQFEWHFYSSFIVTNGVDGTSNNILLEVTDPSRRFRRLSFNGCTINGNPGAANSNNIEIQGGEAVSFNNCDMEAGTVLINGDPNNIRGITFNGGSIALQNITTTRSFIQFERGFGLTVSGTVFRAEGTTSAVAFIQVGSSGAGGTLVGRVDISDSVSYILDGTATLTQKAYYHFLGAQDVVSGTVLKTVKLLIVDTEGAVGTDDIDNIFDYRGTTQHFSHGEEVIIKPNSSARDLVIRHLTGNIRTTSGGSVTLADVNATFTSVWDAKAGNFIQT